MKTKLCLWIFIATMAMACRNSNETEGIAKLKEDIKIAKNTVKVLKYGDSTLAGRIIFAPDSSTVELTLPEATVTLERRIRDNGTPVWNVEDDDTFVVEQKDGKWQISRRERLLYVSK